MLRTCAIAIAVAVLAGCDLIPQTGPMPVVCDEGIPAHICDQWREGRWRGATDLPRERIVRIEVQCVVCEPAGGDGEVWAVLTDGTAVEIAALGWVPEPADQGPPSSIGP